VCRSLFFAKKYEKNNFMSDIHLYLFNLQITNSSERYNCKKGDFRFAFCRSRNSVKDTLTGEKLFYRDIYIEPYIGYFFNRNFGIGAIGGYEFISSNIAGEANQKYFEIGAFSRFYYPFRLNSKKIKGINSTLFFTEISYKFTTYQKVNSTAFES
jgi:hypothetical protein